MPNDIACNKRILTRGDVAAAVGCQGWVDILLQILLCIVVAFALLHEADRSWPREDHPRVRESFKGFELIWQILCHCPLLAASFRAMAKALLCLMFQSLGAIGCHSYAHQTF